MDRPLRRFYAHLPLALCLLALPACTDSDSQQTGQLTPTDPPHLLRIEAAEPPRPITPPFEPVVVPATLPHGSSETRYDQLQPVATDRIDPATDDLWWQAYLRPQSGEPTGPVPNTVPQLSAGPELNAPVRDVPAPTPAVPAAPVAGPVRLPSPVAAPVAAPQQPAGPPARQWEPIERLPAVPAPQADIGRLDRGHQVPGAVPTPIPLAPPAPPTQQPAQQPGLPAFSPPPAMPANPRDAFESPRAAAPAPTPAAIPDSAPRIASRQPASAPLLEEVELGMPNGARISPAVTGPPSQQAQPVIPNYARPEYAPAPVTPVGQPPRTAANQQGHTAASQPQPSTQPSRLPTATPAEPAPPVASAARPAAPPRDQDPMLAVNQRADELIAHGDSLAMRGAHFSARSDHIQALRLITQANDARLGTNSHSQALAAGLRALRESDDFVPQGATLEADLDIAQIISVHRTPVLKDVPNPHELTALVALQAYYTYAQEQFTAAAAGNPSASRALYSLARLHSVMAEARPVEGAVLGPKALALHQAALMTDPNNYRAANELGVLLARYGQLAQARTVFLHGLSIESRPELWQNLATVYERQGDTQLAQRAREQSQIAARQPAPAAEQAAVRWVPNDAFYGPPEGQRGMTLPTAPGTASPPAATPRTATPTPPPRSARSTGGLSDWLPW